MTAPPIAFPNSAAVGSLVRACIAVGRSSLDERESPQDYAARQWKDDNVVGLLVKAAVTPTSLANATALNQVAMSFLSALVPMSAGADLLRRAIPVDFNGAAGIAVPNIAPPTALFVGEEAADGARRG